MEFNGSDFTIFLVLFSLCIAPHVQATLGIQDGNYDRHNCSLRPVYRQDQLKLERLIEQDFRLIELDIMVNWTVQPPTDTYPVQMSWIMTTDNTGERLLLLDDNFRGLSLGTLDYYTDRMKLSLVQEPSDCLMNMTAADAERVFIFNLLSLPTNLKSKDNERGISILHICTGSVASDGSCCDLTYSGNDITCDKLSTDNMLDVLSWIFFTILFISLSNCTYLIPKSVYAETKHSYRTSDPNLKLRVRVVSENTDEKLYRFHELPDGENINGALEILFKESFDRLGTYDEKEIKDFFIFSEVDGLNISKISVEDSALISELCASKGLLKNIYKTFYDIFILCVLKDDPVVRNCCYMKCCCKKCYCSMFCSALVFLLVFGLVIVSVNFDVVPLYDFKKIPFICMINLTLILITYFVLIHYDKNMVILQREQIKILRTLLQTPLKVKLKTCISTIFQSKRKCHCSFNLFCRSLYAIICFLIPFFKLVHPKYGIIKFLIHCNFLLLLFPFIGILSSCIFFYSKVIVYIIIGLFLNYDNIIDEMILALLTLTYIYSCLNGVYHKMNTFNIKVFSLINDVLKERNKEMFDKAMVENQNIAFPLRKLDGTDQTQTMNIFVGDERLFVSVTGLYLFYKYDKFNQLPYLHIPETFLERLSSESCHITPGNKYFLLFRACIEIMFMFFALYACSIVVHGFSRANNISYTVYTLVTVGSSTAVALLNKLIFTMVKFSITDHDMHLKALIEKHLNEYHNPMIKVEILTVSNETPSSNEIFLLPYESSISFASEVVAVVRRDSNNINKYQFCGFKAREMCESNVEDDRIPIDNDSKSESEMERFL